LEEFWNEFGKGIVMVFIIGLAIGLCFLGWAYFLGPLSNNVQYNNFNSSPAHMNAVAQKFSDDCLQIATTTDSTAKKALEQDIYQEAATVDLTKIDIPDDVRSCVNTAISDVNHK
jgi:predicted negative regulator of RcsB-dependent stress response